MSQKQFFLGAFLLVVVLLGGAFFVLSRMSSSVSNDMATTTDSTALDAVAVTPTPANTTTSEKPVVKEPTPTQSLPLLTKEGVYLLYYRDDGFYPKKLTLKLGTSVRFINLSNRTMRVFSSERIDPKFTVLNQSQSVGKGGTYNFTFVSRGDWGFYNQTTPQDAGVVTVY